MSRPYKRIPYDELVAELKQLKASLRGLTVVALDTRLSGRIAYRALKELRKKFRRENVDFIVQYIKDYENGTLYMGDWRRGEIQITGLARIIVNPYWAEVEHTVLLPPDRKRGQEEPVESTFRYIIWNVGMEVGSAALCLTKDNRVVLVRCFRHAERAWVTEIPRGLRLPDEPLLDCALREAQREAGVTLTQDSEAYDLGAITPDTGVLRLHLQLFCFTNVQVDQNMTGRDIAESEMSVFAVSWEQLFEMISQKEIKDSPTISAYAMALIAGLAPAPAKARPRQKLTLPQVA